MDSTPKRRGCSSATIANSKTKCPQRCGHFLWLDMALGRWAPARAQELRVGSHSQKMSASMGFRRSDWLKRGAKHTLVRERRTKAKMPHKTQRSVGCVRRSEDRRQKSPASACAAPGSARSGAGVGERKCHWQKSPASACAEPGRRPLGRINWGSKLPLAIYLWKKRRFSYFGSQHTLMPSVR